MGECPDAGAPGYMYAFERDMSGNGVSATNLGSFMPFCSLSGFITGCTHAEDGCASLLETTKSGDGEDCGRGCSPPVGRQVRCWRWVGWAELNEFAFPGLARVRGVCVVFR